MVYRTKETMDSAEDSLEDGSEVVKGEPAAASDSKGGPRRILGENAAIKDKPGSLWRWVTLVLISLCMVRYVVISIK